MLSTAQPLPNPYALEFEGVATRGDSAGGSPLATLLTNASRVRVALQDQCRPTGESIC